MPQESATQAIVDTAESEWPQDNPGEAYKLGDDFEQLKNAKIMMVDDEPLTMDVVKMLLEDVGYRKFILVEDSVQAMLQLEEHRPDVLLLDVVMPKVSGFDVLRELRSHPEFSHLPVIILTSSADAETKLQALELGATDFLGKPVDPSELALRVRNTLVVKAYQDQLAFYDGVTGLPNKLLFVDQVDWALHQAQRQANSMGATTHRVGSFQAHSRYFGPEDWRSGNQTGSTTFTQLCTYVRYRQSWRRKRRILGQCISHWQ